MTKIKTIPSKKIALLIPWVNSTTKESGYVWETPSEKTLSPDYLTLSEALANKPDQNIYVCCNDAYQEII